MLKVKTIVYAVCLVMASSIGLFAQSSRSITDLMYMPGAGKFYVEPKYSYSDCHQEIPFDFSATVSGVSFSASSRIKDDTASNSFNLVLGYGITQSFSLGISEGYLRVTDTTSTSGTISSSGYADITDSDSDTQKGKGFTDPSLSLKYRIIETPLLLDFSFAYSPKLMKTSDTSMGKGCHSFSGNLDLGNKIDSFSYRIGVGGVYFTKQKFADGDETVTGGHELSLYSDLQYKLFSDFFVKGGISYTLQTPVNAALKSSGDTIKRDIVHQLGISIGAGYAVVPENCVLNANVNFTKILDFSDKMNSPSGPSMNLNYENAYEYGLDISAKFQF
jgi:hypothetical protein